MKRKQYLKRVKKFEGLNLIQDYDSDQSLSETNLKFEALLLASDFKLDYKLQKQQVKLFIERIYSVIDSGVIKNWKRFGKEVDDALIYAKPSIQNIYK